MEALAQTVCPMKPSVDGTVIVFIKQSPGGLKQGSMGMVHPHALRSSLDCLRRRLTLSGRLTNVPDVQLGDGLVVK